MGTRGWTSLPAGIGLFALGLLGAPSVEAIDLEEYRNRITQYNQLQSVTTGADGTSTQEIEQTIQRNEEKRRRITEAVQERLRNRQQRADAGSRVRERAAAKAARISQKDTGPRPVTGLDGEGPVKDLDVKLKRVDESRLK
jgi:hypothetical protein